MSLSTALFCISLYRRQLTLFIMDTGKQVLWKNICEFSHSFSNLKQMSLSTALFCISLYRRQLTLFIMDTGKQVLWKTVKNLMKCHIRWHFISVCTVCSSGTEIHQSIEILTGNPLKYKMDNSILIVSICTRWDNPWKRFKYPFCFVCLI